MKNKTKAPAQEPVKKKANLFLKREFILAVLIINIALRLYIAYQPFEFIDGPFVQDDSYYALTIAKNIANGGGPIYTDEYTNGFQPLYVFLIAPIFLLTKNDLFAPIRASLVISSIIDTLTLFVLIKIFSKSSGSSLTIGLLSVLWIFSFTVISNTLNGLETSLSMLLIVTSFYFFLRIKNENKSRSQITLGVVLGLAVLARIDNIFLAACIILFLFVYFRKTNQRINNIAKSLTTIILFAIIMYLPWAIYSYVYTGDIFPISGKALRLISYWQVDRNPTYENWYSMLISASFKIIYSNNFIPLYVFVFNLLIIFLVGWKEKLKIFRKLSTVNVILISNLLLIISYVFYFFGYWYFSRYFYPVTLLLIMLAVISFDYISAFKNKKLRNLQLVIILAVIGVSILTPEFKGLFYDSTKMKTGFMSLGLWGRASFKDGTVIGACQSGALGYFANNIKVVNLDGVVNKESYLALEEKRFLDYIKKKKIEYIIGWPSNFSMIFRSSPNMKDSDFQPLGKTEFKTMNTQWNVAKVTY